MDEISLILVDLQNDFLDPRSSNLGHLAKAICLPGISLLLSHARKQDWNVIHVRTVHESKETLPVHLQRQDIDPYCLSGTRGAKIIDRLTIEDGEEIISKQGYSGFDGTKLNELVKNSQVLVVAGVAADCCVHQTAFDAASIGKEVYLPFQAISASSIDDYISHMKTVAKSAGFVIDLSELIECKDFRLTKHLPPEKLEPVLRHWFKPRFDGASALELEILDQRTLPFEDILQTLDQRFEKIS